MGVEGWLEKMGFGYLGVAVMVAVSVLILMQVLAVSLLGSMAHMQRKKVRDNDVLDDRLRRLPCIHIVNAVVLNAVVLDEAHHLHHCPTDVRVVALFVAGLHKGRADGSGSREEQGKEGEDELHFWNLYVGNWLRRLYVFESRQMYSDAEEKEHSAGHPLYIHYSLPCCFHDAVYGNLQ